MSKALESGRAFLDQILAKVPEALRDNVRVALTAPEAAEALTTLGDGVLARSDYSKNLDDLRQKETELAADYERLQGWYTANEGALKRVPTLEAEIARLTGQQPPPAAPPAPRSPEAPVSTLTKEEILQILEDRDKGYAGVLALTNALTASHLKTFGEVLDLDQLVAHSRAKGVDLKTAYQQVHKEQLDAKAKADDDARLQKLRDEIRAEVRKESGQPFPLRNGTPSVLDILDNQADKPANHTVDTAAAMYERLQEARG